MNEPRIFAGKYAVIDGEPRKGGMSTIYRCVKLSDGQPVAVKVIEPNPKIDQLDETIFDREMNVSRLDHPNIVRLHDSGRLEETGQFFLVFDWIDHDLQDWVAARRPLGADDFVEEIALPILQALTYAHERDVVHRDVKPSNILIADDGSPKLTDFGISKVKDKLSERGLTVGDFISRPFSPPEIQHTSSYSRDVFAFGALLLWCLAEVPVRDYTDFGEALDDIDASRELIDLVASCVELEETSRPRNAAEVLVKLEALQASRREHWVQSDTIHLKLTVSARRRIASTLEVNEQRAEEFIKRELIDDPAIRRISPKADKPHQPGESHYFIYGQSWRLHVSARAGSPVCTVIAAQELDHTECDEARDRNLVADHVDFVFGDPISHAAASEAVQRLVDRVEQFESERAEALAAREDRRLLDEWRRQLDAREAFDQRSSDRLRFRKGRVDGMRLTVNLTTTPETDLSEQRRRVLGPAGAFFASGYVDSHVGDEIVLYLDREPSRQINDGTLALDSGASSVKLRRERGALEAVRHQSPALLREDLAQLIVHPTQASPPRLGLGERAMWFQELDESKQAAVQTALGSDDFVVIEGPPGTGKTTFIAELVAQTLADDPDSRILLASQTHVAADNALMRIRDLPLDITMLRIGNPNAGKIDESVLDLTLDHRLQEWRRRVERRSERFLDRLAAQTGVALEDIRLSINLRRLAAATQRSDELDRLIGERRTQIAQSEALDAASTEVLTAEDIEDLQAEIARFREQLAELRSEMKELRSDARVAARQDALSNPNDHADLRVEAARALGSTSNSNDLVPLVDLQAEWLQRMGRGPDFQTALLQSTQVVGATCIGLAQFPGIELAEFDLCIVDEASKATATETLVPLVRSRRWVLVGDENQLPPFQDEALRDDRLIKEFDLDERELNRSLFSRMAQGLPAANKKALTKQYRMVDGLGELISECFYEGKLENAGVRSPGWVTGLQPAAVTWYSTQLLSDRNERRTKTETSYSNPCEVSEVIKHLKRIDYLLASQRVEERISILVLAPYQAQVAALHRAEASESWRTPGLHVEVNTVDAAQGREADVLLFSATRSNPQGIVGFVRDLARANVALSRGRFLLGVFGDAPFFDQAESPIGSVISHIRTHPANCQIVEIEP